MYVVNLQEKPRNMDGEEVKPFVLLNSLLQVKLEDTTGRATLSITVKDELDISSPLVPVLSTLPINVKEEIGISTPPSFNKIEGNPEQQHSTMKQLDSPNSVICGASLHTPLRAVGKNNEGSMTQEPEYFEPSQIDLHSETSQANREFNTAQEPKCLGPFFEQSSIKCPKCSVVLMNYSEIFRHPCTSEHMYRELSKKKPKCCFCDYEFSNRRSLEKHLKKYVEKRYVKCSICGKCFTCASSFKQHAPVHTNLWPYHCDICGQGIASERYLEIHKTTHTKEKSWMCDICGAMFANNPRLLAHKTVHSERKYECDMCCKRFKNSSHLKSHKKVHSVRETFACGECSSVFKSKYQFKMHKEIKHSDNSGGESFICSACSKEFRHRHAFKCHMKKHKSRNENVMYTCDMCKRNLSSKWGLSIHIAAHYGKQFSCSYCGMLFTQRGSVKRHMLKLHSIEG